MELVRRALLLVRRRWVLLLLPVLIGAVCVVVYDTQFPRSYTATASLFLRAPDVKTSASAYQGNLFTMQRANTYVNMVESDELGQLVVDRLGLSESAHELATKVKAAPIRDTVIVNISVTDRDPQFAANVANTYGNVFATYVAKVEAVSPAADVPPLVTIVKPAGAEDAKSSRPSLGVLLGIAVVLGLLVGIVLAWVAERYDTRIRSRRQLEEQAHSRVLGNLSRPKALRDGAAIEEVMNGEPVFADQARVIGAGVVHALSTVDVTDRAPVLLMASVNDDDGRSAVAQALANVLEERGVRVALVDAVPEDVLPQNGFRTAIADAVTDHDYVIVDPNAAGASLRTRAAASLSDAAVIVVMPSRTHTYALRDLVDELALAQTPVIGIVTDGAVETKTVARHYA